MKIDPSIGPVYILQSMQSSIKICYLIMGNLYVAILLMYIQNYLIAWAKWSPK